MRPFRMGRHRELWPPQAKHGIGRTVIPFRVTRGRKMRIGLLRTRDQFGTACPMAMSSCRGGIQIRTVEYPGSSWLAAGRHFGLKTDVELSRSELEAGSAS